MIVIKPKKVEIDENQLSNYQKQYEDFNVFICPTLFDISLKELIDKHFITSKFSKFVHESDDGKLIAQEYVIPSDFTLPKILNFYLNRKEIIDIVKEITGITQIKSFHGRVFRFEADQYSFDTWHSDTIEGRLVGLSINMSDSPFEGGEFKIRDMKTGQISKTVVHQDWGSSHFFRIRNDFQHKVEKVSGDTPRIAFAGWFNNRPLFN